MARAVVKESHFQSLLDTRCEGRSRAGWLCLAAWYGKMGWASRMSPAGIWTRKRGRCPAEEGNAGKASHGPLVAPWLCPQAERRGVGSSGTRGKTCCEAWGDAESFQLPEPVLVPGGPGPPRAFLGFPGTPCPSSADMSGQAQ